MRDATCAVCCQRFIATGARGPLPRKCDECDPGRVAARGRASAQYDRKLRRPYGGWTRQCLTCQKVFVQRYQGPAAIYCSHDCREWWRAFSRRARTSIQNWALGCKVCGRPVYERGVLTPPGIPRVYCSPECGQYDRGVRAIIHDRCRVPWRTCRECGKDFVGFYQRSEFRLCPTCSGATAADRNRRKNRKRRLLGRSGSYSMTEVAERDGYRCHLCRKPVDMTLSGNDKRGPTIDHLIPLCAGGDDVLENVALAHRSCNCARGSRGIVQLRLAA